MINIQTLDKIAAIGTDNFDSKYTVGNSVENPAAVLVRSSSMHEMEFGSELKAIARAGAGVNNIPIDKCSEQGICVFNTPGANANAVKELVITALLLASRKVFDGITWAQGLKGKGSEVGKLVEKGKSQFAGPEIQGKTLGVIGFGAIGVKVANAAAGLGMKVIGYDPFLSVNSALGLQPVVNVVKSVKEVFDVADYLTIHVPYNADTKGYINSETIALMKDGVSILNFSRGELVNDTDIIKALNDGKVKTYVTDFPSDEVIGVNGVIPIPHLGASTPESEDNCAYMAAVQVIDYLENGNIKNSVNLPDAEMHKTGNALVCVIHKNVPSAISLITTAVSSTGGNIENLLNKSKKEYAYTMIDLNTDVEVDVKAIEKIDGVIKVRVI